LKGSSTIEDFGRSENDPLIVFVPNEINVPCEFNPIIISISYLASLSNQTKTCMHLSFDISHRPAFEKYTKIGQSLKKHSSTEDLLAIIALINQNAADDVDLPFIFVEGSSGSGKTQLLPLVVAESAT
jgi:hypothetical protein